MKPEESFMIFGNITETLQKIVNMLSKQSIISMEKLMRLVFTVLMLMPSEILADLYTWNRSILLGALMNGVSIPLVKMIGRCNINFN